MENSELFFVLGSRCRDDIKMCLATVLVVDCILLLAHW